MDEEVLSGEIKQEPVEQTVDIELPAEVKKTTKPIIYTEEFVKEQRIGYFKNENHLCDFLEDNLEKFSEEWLGGKVSRYRREWFFKEHRKFGGNRPRIDFMLEVNGKRIGIECKRASQSFHESTRAISQLLSYGVLAEENGNKFDEMILLTSSFEETTLKIIRKYNLPIRYFVLTRNYTAEMK
jgi:hypothetical protein